MADKPPLYFEKRCMKCETPLARKDGERRKQFAARVFCDRNCAYDFRAGNLDARFWEKVIKLGQDECWEWNGQKWPSGHGILLFRGNKFQATHVSLLIAGHEQPHPSLMALHSCDNPPCVNPVHLRWGTSKDNVGDMFERERDRIPRGKQNGHAKLTDAIVRDLRKSDEPLSHWANKTGVSVSTLSSARNGKTWRHVI